jgi:hypothetical protein
MSDAKMNNALELVIIGLLVIDVFLEYKMVYGVYPWEQAKAAS